MADLPPNTPQDFRAPEILAALQKFAVDLGAARAEIASLSQRVTRTSARTAASPRGIRNVEGAGTSEEVASTTRAVEGEQTARTRLGQLQAEELNLQREITAEVERTDAAYTVRDNRVAAGTSALGPGRYPGNAQQVVEHQRLLEQINTQARADAVRQSGFVTAPDPRYQPKLPGEAEVAAPPPIPRVAPQFSVAPPAETAAIVDQQRALTDLRAEHLKYQDSTRSSSVLTGEFVNRLLSGKSSMAEFGNQLGVAAGKYAGFTAAAAGVGVAIGGISEIYKGAKDASSGADQLKRSIDNLDTTKAQEAFRQLSNELNLPIKDVSDAVFQLSRTFHSLPDAVEAGRVALQANKVDSVSLADATRTLTAVHQQFGLSAQQLSGYLDLLDYGQRKYNARVNDTIQATQKAAAAYKLAGGTATGLVNFLTYAERVTALPGNQIGTAVYRAASNTLRNPTNQAQIAALGLDPKLAETNIDEFFNQAIRLAKTKGKQWIEDLAIAIGGKQQGGKVFAPILASGDINLLNDIQQNQRPGGASDGSTQKELNDILNRTDEVLKSIGIQLQSLGANLAQSGILDSLGLALKVLVELLRTVNEVASAFNHIPSPLKEIVSNLTVAAATVALLRKAGIGADLVGGLRGKLLGNQEGLDRKGAAAVLDANLAASQQARGSVLARQLDLSAGAQTDRGAAAIAANEEERKGLLLRAESADEQVAQLGRRLIVIDEAIAAQTENRAALGARQIAASEALLLEEQRLGGLAGAGAATGAAGAAGGLVAAEASGGLLAGLKSGLGKALGVGLVASIVAPIVGDALKGQGGPLGAIGNALSTGATGLAAGAAIGSFAGPLGTVAGAGLGLLATQAGGIARSLAGSDDPSQTRQAAGFDHAQGDLFQALLGQTDKATRGQLDSKQVQDLHERLKSLAADPNYAGLLTNLDQLTVKLDKLDKAAGSTTFLDFATATRYAKNSDQRATVDQTIKGKEGDYAQAIKDLERARPTQKEQAKGVGASTVAAAINDQKTKALAGISSIIDANTALANAQTQDKTQQLTQTLQADNDKLALTLKLFGKNSNEYKNALAKSLVDQQQIAQQAITTIGSQGALRASQIQTRGPEGDLARSQVNLQTLQQELVASRRAGADPNAVRGLETQINDAQRALAQTVNDQAKQMRDAGIALRQAQTLNPVKQAQLGLQGATSDLQGLTGAQRVQQLATVQNARNTLNQAIVTNDLAQLSYESHIHAITDNTYISGLQEILRTKRLSTDQRRQLLTQIYDLQNQNKNSSSSLDLNVGAIKLPTIYEIRRAIAGGTRAAQGTIINNSPTVNVAVRNSSDVGAVTDALDKTLGTTARSAARAQGIL